MYVYTRTFGSMALQSRDDMSDFIFDSDGTICSWVLQNCKPKQMSGYSCTKTGSQYFNTVNGMKLFTCYEYRRKKFKCEDIVWQ